MREVVAEFRNPVRLSSVGENSSVKPRPAQTATHPGRCPFPLAIPDTVMPDITGAALLDQRHAGDPDLAMALMGGQPLHDEGPARHFTCTSLLDSRRPSTSSS